MVHARPPSGDKLDADRALNSTFQVISRNGVEVSTTVKTISLSGCYRLDGRRMASLFKLFFAEIGIRVLRLETNE
jgi:hypothetical protein